MDPPNPLLASVSGSCYSFHTMIALDRINVGAEEVENEICRILAREAQALSGRTVFLFGSRATGTARPESDFDIGILGENPLPLADYYRILDRLEDIPTLFSFDLVDLNRADPALKKAAESQGRVLYEA